MPCDYIRLIILKQKKYDGVEEDTITCSCFERICEKITYQKQKQCAKTFCAREKNYGLSGNPPSKTDFITTSFCKKSLLKLDMTPLSIDL